MPDPDLRPARTGDLPRIRRIITAAYTPWIARIGQRPAPLDTDYGPAIAAGQVRLLHAEGTDPLALLVLVPQPDALLIENIAVHPDAQGRGLGRRLLAEAESLARRAGHPRLRLYTHRDMAANLALYTAHGFQETARVTEDGLPRVYMEMPLG